MIAPADPRAPVCQSWGTSRQGPQSCHRLSPARAGRAGSLKSRRDGVAVASRLPLRPRSRPVVRFLARLQRSCRSADHRASAPTPREALAAACRDGRREARPAPSVARNWRASSYAAVRPIRSTAAASSTVKKSGNGPPDTTRPELDVTPLYPPSAHAIRYEALATATVTTEREPARAPPRLSTEARTGRAQRRIDAPCRSPASRWRPGGSPADLGHRHRRSAVRQPAPSGITRHRLRAAGSSYSCGASNEDTARASWRSVSTTLPL